MNVKEAVRDGIACTLVCLLAVVGCQDQGPVGADSLPVPLRQPNLSEQAVPIVASSTRLTASGPHSYFGRSVSMSGDLAQVGARAGSGGGGAYFFRRAGTAWPEEDAVVGSGGTVGDFFGRSVSADGDVAIVGAPADDDFGFNFGSASIFRRSGTTWIEEEVVGASDGASSDAFGEAVTIDEAEGVAAVGALQHDAVGHWSGAVYVYRNTGPGWSLETKLIADDALQGDQFGASVSVSGDRLLVGAPARGDLGPFTGAAYVFRYDGANWEQEQKLIPLDAGRLERYGESVSLDGELAIVGAPGGGSSFRIRSAYVFRRLGSSWDEEAKLTASDGGIFDRFGVAVSIDAEQEMAIVGANQHDGAGDNAGAAYLFENSSSGWLEWGKLLPEQVDEGDWFGSSVAIDGESAIVGAYRDDDLGLDAGAAYLFSLTLADRIDFLKAAIDELVADGSLTPYQGNIILKTRLDLAQRFLEQGLPQAAIPALNIFILQVQRFIDDGTLTSEEGQPLIDGAQAIIENIGG